MNVLLVGSGGREHAIAWKLAQSPLLENLYILPGNAGTAELGANVSIPAEDIPAIVKFARSRRVDLAVIGPEVPLSMGLADELLAAGMRVFGPTRAAARIESSKAFSKDFMQRHGIPTASHVTFQRYEDALNYVESNDSPIVIKASGLAAGKGVFLPQTVEEARECLKDMLVDWDFGAAGAEVVIEERLEGEEVSLMAFTDGTTVRTMPPAQDHKRLLDGDRGPNTGGMGAYAPAPACPPEMVEELTRTVLLSVVNGLRKEGTPFVGVIYAGLMLTTAGPRVLEFNCRFGDPETQAVLPLLETDLLEVIDACAGGTLNRVNLRWDPGSAVCVVLATGAYPASSQKGLVITGLESADERSGVYQLGTEIFHAGTAVDGSRVVTAGGRVLGVTAWGNTLPEALQHVYKAIEDVHFEGMQYRKDIGWRGLQHLQRKTQSPSGQSYRSSGVNIDAGNQAVELMSASVRSTYTPAVLAGIGAFGGLFDAQVLKTMQAPVLVSSTDGVGTKIKLASEASSYRSIGQDIVNHCINDILVQGAKPLFFLDYIASPVLSPSMVAEVVAGIAAACKQAGCVLIGGETAEMPGVYAPGEFDLAGTIVGVVEREEILPRASVQPGDLLVGLKSSGPHTNGFSLIRKVFEDVPLDTLFPDLKEPLGQALLRPHRSYLGLLSPFLHGAHAPVKALAHITGGGFIENIPRVLPAGAGAVIHPGSWPMPPLFTLIQRRGSITPEEMARVFNLGVGMVAVVSPQDAPSFQRDLGEESWVIGEVVAGDHQVELK
jgi:phosphoribosylamine--glycine ligase/phosphoribosylaminoimidazole synthetase